MRHEQQKGRAKRTFDWQWKREGVVFDLEQRGDVGLRLLRQCAGRWVGERCSAGVRCVVCDVWCVYDVV